MNAREEALQAKLNQALNKLPRLQAKVTKVRFGHTYCRCYLEVGATVKEHKIQSYAEYLARELRLETLPIVHTIFNEGAIVIDIPNDKRSIVQLETCLKSDNYKTWIDDSIGLPYVVGVDNGGDVICGDLTKAPHVMIAGQSGSGKSVAIRCILNSLLAAWAEVPNRCQLVLLDPKGVELIHYRELEQAIMYSSDPEEITQTLEALVDIMEERYQEFVSLADTTGKEIFDIEAYNKYYCQELGIPSRAYPYIVVFIDELADILLNNKLCEQHILRLVQKARAAGIHIVMATQRPSSDIISGPIRANVPTKICCKVSRPIDGRVVFGDGDYGAHRLLGHGDMMYIDESYPEPIRLQGAFTDLDFLRSYVRYREKGKTNVIQFDPNIAKLGTNTAPVIAPFDVHSYSIKQMVYG